MLRKITMNPAVEWWARQIEPSLRKRFIVYLRSHLTSRLHPIEILTGDDASIKHALSGVGLAGTILVGEMRIEDEKIIVNGHVHWRK